MGYINLPDTLKAIFDKINYRLDKLENSMRFTAPVVTTDPTNPRKGDIWINSTTNVMKAVDSAGTVRIITWT